MKGDDLKNWLAVLGIGGGLALAGTETVSGEIGRANAGAAAEPPRAERGQGPVYVVINHEEQYSIWPAQETLPRGWKVLHDEIELDDAVKRLRRVRHQRYKVMINHEEQYAIWPRDRRLPKGFRVVEALRELEPCRIDECGRRLKRLEGGGGGF